MKTTTSTRPWSAQDIRDSAEWQTIKESCAVLQSMQIKDGSIPDASGHHAATTAVTALVQAVSALAPHVPHDSAYLEALTTDCTAWADGGFAVPDFYDSLTAFHPEATRMDGTVHVVVFPMYTQNGSTNRFVEAVLCETIWPDFVSNLESGSYGNPMFIPLRFIDFTAGYDTNSAVLFPESVAVTPRVPTGAPEGTAPALPAFTWGAIFADREAARFRNCLLYTSPSPRDS